MLKYIPLFLCTIFLISYSNDREKLEDKIHNLEIDKSKLENDLKDKESKIKQPSETENELHNIEKENSELKQLLKTFEQRINSKKVKGTYYVEEVKKLVKKLTSKEKILEILGKPDSRNITINEYADELTEEDWEYKNIINDEFTGERKSLIIHLKEEGI